MGFGALQVLWRQYAARGNAPSVAIDTQDRSPPIYDGTAPPRVLAAEVAPDATVTLALPVAACSFLLLATEPVAVALKAGDTVLPNVRVLLIGAADAAGEAMPAQSLVLTGNPNIASTVEVFALPKVG